VDDTNVQERKRKIGRGRGVMVASRTITKNMATIKQSRIPRSLFDFVPLGAGNLLPNHPPPESERACVGRVFRGPTTAKDDAQL
jgi:hypothetical protein